MSGPPDRTNAGTTLLEVEDVRKEFRLPSDRLFENRQGIVKAIDGVSFTMRRGETLALVGETGSGKSTLGRVLLHLQAPTAGSVTFEGVDLGGLNVDELRRLRRRMQMIYQDPYGSLNPRKTVVQIVSAPLKAHGLGDRAQRRERVHQLLNEVGLSSDFEERYPHQFSGGQQQRIAIARALSVDPEFVVADEPVSALDVSVQAQILNLLADLQRERKLTYLLIAHDLSIVRQASDRTAVMYFGAIVELAPSDELYDNPCHPYTAALLSAVPVPDPGIEAQRERIILEGDPPSPTEEVPGCRFSSRCPMVQDKCRTSEPPLTEVAPGRFSACFFPDEVGHLAGSTLRISGTPSHGDQGSRQ